MNGGARLAVRMAWLAALATMCAACASVPPVQLAYASGSGDALTITPLPCVGDAPGAAPAPDAGRLPGPQLRILSWNLHKNADPGWEADLARFAAESDLLLIQEVALTPALREVLGAAGHVRWTMAGSWGRGGVETGVLSGARVAPLAACIQRSIEPLLQVPKTALIARYALQGGDAVLAVANVHAINFTLGLDEYRAQLAQLTSELAGHRGPIVVGGDFNTWSQARLDAMHEAMQRLGLVAVLPQAETRSRVLGRQIDFIFLRGLEVVAASAPLVASSDHNPLLATLRVPPTAASR
jgi:endonuclease/exonuclease/phosphatase (EEP) superfamily protein YafD